MSSWQFCSDKCHLHAAGVQVFPKTVCRKRDTRNFRERFRHIICAVNLSNQRTSSMLTCEAAKRGAQRVAPHLETGALPRSPLAQVGSYQLFQSVWVNRQLAWKHTCVGGRLRHASVSKNLGGRTMLSARLAIVAVLGRGSGGRDLAVARSFAIDSRQGNVCFN